MKRSLSALLCTFILAWCAGCGGSAASTQAEVIVHVMNPFSTIEVGSAAVTLNVSVTGASGSSGVVWTLSLAGASCSPSCGTLKPASGAALTAVYTPPVTVPLNALATITARSVADDQVAFVFNFQILPPITVSIGGKFTIVMVAGAAQNLTATVTNDVTTAGVTWTLTAGGANCQPGCGTLTVAAAPSLSAQYTPPTTPPSTANASPTITATAVADTSKNDGFNFTITTPAVTVTITNPFTSTFTNGAPITVNAVLTNDFLNQGVTWTLTTANGACTAACGTLVAVGTPSLSAVYTPPPTPATNSVPTPIITAISVADRTANASFTFTLVLPTSLITGNYAFLLRGYDQGLQPMAVAGSFTADGAGNITNGEYDLNDNTALTSVASLSGSYTIDTSFNQIPRVTFTLTSGGTSLVLVSSFSADGKRGKAIELDGSLALNAGNILRQDLTAATALASSTGPTSFAFGLDSDAPIDGRVVEAGQFILGAGAASVTGGIADAGQAGAATAIFGGVGGAAAINAGASTATPPDAFGRGTLTISVGGAATQYAYYVVDGTQMFVIETDAGGTLKTVQAGTAKDQQALTATSIQANSVAALTGMTDVGGSPSPDVIVGVLSTTGAAPTAKFDANNAGAVVAFLRTSTGSFSSPFDPSTGRAVISGTFLPDAVVYLYNTGSGFIADITPSTDGTNQGLSGPLMVQTVSPGNFSLATLTGNSIMLGGATSSSSLTNLDMGATFIVQGNQGTFSGEFDFTLANLGIGANGQGQNVLLLPPPPSTFGVDDPTSGHGELTQIPSGFFNDFPVQADSMSFYIIGPNQFVAIEDLGLSSCDILFFDPQQAQ
jgi:hypothetical protein